MSAFTKVLENNPEYLKIIDYIYKDRFPSGIIGLSQAHKAHYISSLVQDTEKTALVICPDEASASKLCDDLNSFHSGACLYPARDYLFRGSDSKSLDFEQKRLGVLRKIIDKEVKYVVCSVEAAVQLTIPRDELIKRCLKIEVGQEITTHEVVNTLISAGYTRTQQVEGTGQFSLRGGILDIFPPGSEFPARIEFWGDNVDSLALFDTESQRRKDNIQSLTITPSCEVLFDSLEDMKDKLTSFLATVKGKGSVKAKASINEDIEKLEHFIRVGSDRYLSLAYNKPETVFDYMENELIFVCESAQVKQKYNSVDQLFMEDLRALSNEGIITKGIDTYILTWAELLLKYEKGKTFYTDALARGSFDTPVKELVSINVNMLPRWNGTLSYLLEDLQPLVRNGYTVTVMAGTEKNAKELAYDLETEGIKAKYFPVVPAEFPASTVSVIAGTLSSGIEYQPIKYALFTYGKATDKAPKKSPKHFKKGKSVISLDELSRGDYVVHAVYGIGIYDGIHTKNVSGKLKDFIKINYRGSDVLYLTVTQLDLISKYISPKDTDKVIRLNRLGSDEWEKTQKKVRSGIKDMAGELTKLYAARLNSKGFAFSPDIDMQNDFERRFEFEETDDQLEAINEIKADMEKESPMDRLLCGDVGFGKTEVALRAAFKCIADGKQCAILVPTTILAFQHFQTIRKRFDGFPVEIDMISRFRTPSERTKIKSKLKRGSIDIIVGTHSIIASSVQFKDLGLLIVDEEQRFGVAQKEKLKEKFPNVDVLTLSATPIPRTLNMAMTGIRDMSVLEIPPMGRHPVQSYVIPHDMSVLAEAMDREIRRGGQIYYLHNRIDTIYSRASQIQKYLPDARIGVGHGQMSEEELSEIWRQLLENEIDILICTTIIETGVDVPNANTLIIEDADRLGLAQLHQIRGRVGRSSRRAYAYFTYSPNRRINETAQRRLSAIREFTEFGSGFRIAMRDLEIRGAGNVLGVRQHGHMEAVGYDMYLKLLSQVIEEEKTGEPVKEKKECIVDIAIDAHIPESYIQSAQSRIAMYKRIAEIEGAEDAMDVMDEFIDRFGDPPKYVEGLVKVALLRAQAANLGIYEIRQNQSTILAYVSDLRPEYIVAVNEHMRTRCTVKAGKNSACFSVELKGKSPVEAIKDLIVTLSKA